MRGIRLAGLLALVASFAACDSTPLERASASCTVICGCFLPPVPSQQEECITECIGDLGGFLSEECTSCIAGHVNQCSTLEIDCEPICDIDDDPPPPIDDPVGDPPML
jgi:hypothetical protein